MSQELWAITQTTKCIQTVVLVVIAAVVVVFDKEMFFHNKQPSAVECGKLIQTRPL
jgi:hypothetical protein